MTGREEGKYSSSWEMNRVQERRRGARWANAADLRPITLSGGEGARLVLGNGAGRGRLGRTVLAAEPGQSVAIVGPTQSGKTTGLVVPSILRWDGPILATSVKTDLLRDTLKWRRKVGRVWQFDPSGVTGMPGNAWSPLIQARTWNGARRVAAGLTEVASTADLNSESEFWYATAAKLLAPLLFAAATDGRQIKDVIRWVDTQEIHEVSSILAKAQVPEALQAARATWLRDERQRSSVYTTAETVLEPLSDVTQDGRAELIDPDALLDGPNTLYVCSPTHEQRRLRAVFVCLVKQVLEAAFSQAGRLGKPLDPPLLVVLDEAAHIAPLTDLDAVAATCVSYGVQLVTVWQDYAQINVRYGARAATILNNHRAQIFLSGISDTQTLDQASHLVGDEEAIVPSATWDHVGNRATSEVRLRRPLLPPEELRCMRTGTGVLLYGSLPPVRLKLQPWWRNKRLLSRSRAR